MIAIGIDPGLSGAIAIINESSVLRIHDCPVLPKEPGEKFRKHNAVDMFNMIPSGAIAVIEHVHFDWRDDGKKGSAETLIRTHAAWLAMLEIKGCDVRSLHPPTWRSLAGCGGLGANKEELVRYALQLFPKQRNLLKRRSARAKAGFVWEHGRAEALLMAYVAQSLALKEAGEVA